MSRHSRANLVPFAVLLSGALAFAAFAQGQPPSGPGGGASSRSVIAKFASNGADWAWIIKRGGRTELWSGGPGSQGRKVAEGSGWAGVAVGSGQLWLIQAEGDRGNLLQTPRGAAGEPRLVASCSGRPTAVFALDQQAYWLELTQGRDPGLGFIPTLGGTLRLRKCDAAGTASTLAEWPSGGRLDPRDIDIIGVTGDRLYLSVYNGVGTEFLAAPLDGGGPVRVAAEANREQGVIHRDRLVWTAPSDEATPVSGIRQVRTQQAGGAPAVLADWVPAIGNILSVGGNLHYAGVGNAYRIPEADAPPEYTGPIAFGDVVTDGKSMIEISGDAPVAKAP